MPKKKNGKMSKAEAKKLLNQVLDRVAQEGDDMKDSFMQAVGQLADKGLKGGGFDGFVDGLVHGGGQSGGGTAKSIGKVGNKLANVGTLGLWGSGQSGGKSGGGTAKSLGKVGNKLANVGTMGLWGSGQGGASGGGSDGRQSRGQLVRQVMDQKGLSLPQASKYVKDNDLYVPEGQRKKGSGKAGGIRILG
eukprot:gb/GECG01011724.1/.p1 GENE.gb/GECG01011724.1/~~gb/GECG01011724.1/.p1  ORF type:complete len:191 (+),score=21.07 gb/GECG01011724.1/:1-573(+)